MDIKSRIMEEIKIATAKYNTVPNCIFLGYKELCELGQINNEVYGKYGSVRPIFNKIIVVEVNEVSFLMAGINYWS